MSEIIENPQVEAQRQEILAARKKGLLSTLGVYARFSGPGWLQSATTLGGGSLASALYLGVLGGVGFMWLQPFAMIMGIIMLSAISYITLSIKDKPMVALNKNISPILGYGWALASMAVCLVFAMPQFALGVAAITQNIIPSMGEAGVSKVTEVAITAGLFALAMGMVFIYSIGGKGMKLFEILIKLSVAAIVICFFGVTISLAVSGKIDFGRVMEGFVPNFSVFSEPSSDFMVYISALVAPDRTFWEGCKEFWSNIIVSQQRDVVISAAATAVGLNMTFLFPYSMLKKGWNKDFRSLAIFDLCTGLFIPYLIATSCIVVSAASQFHAVPDKGLIESRVEGDKVVAISTTAPKPAKNLIGGYIDLLDKRIEAQIGEKKFASLDTKALDALRNALPKEERAMAAMLVKRDASNLSETLVPLVGEDVARYIFGFGVLGMAINAMLMNMLICGVSFAKMLGKDGKEAVKWELIGSALVFGSAAVSIFFEGAKMWLVIYAGVIAMVFLPIAYGAFLLIMNSRRIMGESTPRGLSRVVWNVLMFTSVGASSIASLWVLWSKLGIAGPIAFAVFLVIVAISYVMVRRRNAAMEQ